PNLLLENVRKYGNKRDAIREKDYGIWQSYTYRECLEQVRLLALGLASLGFKRGDKTAIIGDNRPELYWSMTAALCLGGIPVPLFQDAIEEEMHYVLDHSETRFAVAEDQEQTDKLLNLKDRCPHLEYIIYKDPRGMRHYKEPLLLSFSHVRELGGKFAAAHEGFFEEEIRKGKKEDLAVICYTSGTTGRPKGVMLSHENVIRTAQNSVKSEGLNIADEVMAYLPMAWIGDFMFSMAQAFVAGFTINCPESTATVSLDTKDIGPTYLLCPPRIWENMLTEVMIKVEDADFLKRKLFRFFMDVGQRLVVREMNNEPVSLGLRFLYKMGEFFVYGPLKDHMGLRHVRVALTGGDPLGPEIFEFYRALGINFKMVYGMTESSALVSIHKDDLVKSDTVGPPLPEVEIKISDDREVLYRSPGVFLGYYKNPEATEETLEDGWVHSGDAGFLDKDGHLKIIDRAKDVSTLSTGTIFAPKYIENKLKFSPYIKEAVAIGMDKPYVVSFINIDQGAVGNWAERRSLPYTSYTDIAQKPEVYDLIYHEAIRVNKSLAEDEQLRGAQIHKYLILHKELDPDDEEITRTRKIRRRFIAEKYAELIDALYSDRDSVEVKAKVTYEDGRTTMINADLKIREVEVFADG
ncbi:MAG: long-chain fatty acid--CoA ligase, partial [Deltaproteobacteria bacterium]|nr:long-chain fatty acid--CoA ligase [Deltaproteobacteria bacterium]